MAAATQGCANWSNKRPAGAKENRRLAVDPPRQGLGAEDSLDRSGRRLANGAEPVFKIIGG